MLTHILSSVAVSSRARGRRTTVLQPALESLISFTFTDLYVSVTKWNEVEVHDADESRCGQCGIHWSLHRGVTCGSKSLSVEVNGHLLLSGGGHGEHGNSESTVHCCKGIEAEGSTIQRVVI